MKIISHRGNINGSIPDKENRPSYIDCAINLGYDVEVDIRFINNQFWLGHDGPQYKIELPWMLHRIGNIWFHCKDSFSATKLLSYSNDFLFFCHSNDDYVLTSINKLWIHDLTSKIDGNCIIPLLTLEQIKNYNNSKPFAVCTDYVKQATAI